mmetsp:Transcript_14471/g.27597  ORF Transcript_14471/g.27597 Transcript_14471/m.27597 type:complete len:237 (+) Transcript_14471:2574-3284(+)
MARAGLSTDWTKVTPAISCMISGTSFGLVMALTMCSVMCSMSLLPMTSQAPFMAAVAADLTCFLVSHMHAVTSGTTSGRALPSCLGAESLKTARHSRARTRICHFFSTGSSAKMMGRRDFMAKGVMFLQMARAQSLAAFFTAGLLFRACSKHEARTCLLNASASGAPSATACAVANAAHAVFSSFAAALATREPMPAAKPDLSAPSALMASTTDGSSPRDRFSSLDSRDMFMLKFM